jgi:hypothetical protein
VKAALLLAVVCAGIFFRAMDRDLNHDEHQFLAPAALLSREGLLPYRDYPLFHLPNLTLIYAALDRLTGALLLSAKCVSVASTCGVAILLCGVALRRGGGEATRPPWLLACAGLALFLCDPLTVATTGKTWNHELPAFLTVAALLLHWRGGERDSLLCLTGSGALLGLAIGTRLTYAPLAMPLALFPLLYPLPWRRRIAHVATFCAAGVVASAPSLYFLIADREAFLFGNLEFPRLRLLDPENTRIRKTMAWWRKLRYFAKEIVVPGWPLFLAYAWLGARPAIAWLRARRGAGMAAALVLCVLPFALLGCFAPSRYQYQHYYVFAPLLVLGALVGARSPLAHFRARRPLGIFATASVLMLLAPMIGGPDNSFWFHRSLQREEWFASKAKALGRSIREQAPEGKVLTLAPTWVLAGGGRIYPEFATGPFAWRSAHFAAPEVRQRLKLIAPADLDALLHRDPPAGILSGVEDEKLEAPLVAWAKSNRFRPHNLAKRRVLWLPPGDKAE